MKRYRILQAYLALSVCCAALSVRAEETATQPVEAPPQSDSPGFFRTIISGLFGSSPSPNPFDEAPSEGMFGELPSAPVESGPASNAREKVELQSDYEVAVREAQLRNRPLLVLLGADWCTWCRKLEEDLAKPEATSLLTQWIIVKVDVDDEPEIASRLEASALPGLRILDPLEKRVASREGYVELAELKTWLAAHRKSADPVLQRVLFDTSPPNEAAVEQLISLLGETSPTTRAAAMERLAAHPSKSATLLVETLKAGRLIQQLSAREVLRRMEAPIEDLDPWRPETLSDAKFMAVLTWSKERMEIDGDTGKPSDRTLDAKVVEELIGRLLRADATQRTSLIAQLVSLGPEIAAEARVRLANSEIEDDGARERLRELLYNALAGRSLRIKQPGLLAALAALDADSHRQAAESVMKQATSDDQVLVDELSRDADPLVRELSVQALGRLGILPDGDRIAVLLKDSSPNVRTAVLRALAAHPSDKAVQSLCDYLRDETNEDLLVHGAKCLAQLAQKPETFETLGILASNESWRVRAAAIEAAGQVLDGNSSSNPGIQYRVINGKMTKLSDSALPEPLTHAIVAAAFESDKFVAERALQLLPKLMNEKLIGEEALQGIAERLGEHPDQLQLLVGQYEVQRYGETYAPLVELAKNWLAEDNGNHTQHAAVLLSELAPTELNDRLAKLIASENHSIRLAGLKAAVDSASAYRQASLEAARVAWAAKFKEPVIEPWFESPNPTEAEAPAEEVKISTNKESPAKPIEDAEEPTTADDISLAADFFGGAAPAPAKPDSEKVTEQARGGEGFEIPSNTESSFDSVKNLFGDNPAPPPTILPPPSVSTAPKIAIKRPIKGDPALALPSKWMEEWHGEDAKNHPAWLTECDAPTELLLESDDPQERAWALTLWLVLGHSDRAEQLVSTLATLREADKAAADDLKRVDILSWLMREQLLAEVKRQVDELDGDEEQIVELLKRATWVDDAALADWLFEVMEQPGLSDADLNETLAQIVVRSRVGFFAEELPSQLSASSYQYEDQSPYRVKKALQTTRIPGRAEACNWLRERFEGAATNRQRAIILTALARLDHQAAVDAALSAIQSAEAEDETLKVALAIALFDASKPSAQRAVEFLNHKLPKVQLAALDLLASPGNVLHLSEQPSVPVVANVSGHLPGFWSLRDAYSLDNLKELAGSDDPRQQAQAKLLLLAAGEQIDLADLPSKIEELYQNHGNLLIATALAKAEKTDEPALKHYEKTFTSAANDSIAAGLYAVLRNLKGAEVAQLRRRMREEKGSSLFNNTQEDLFSSGFDP